MRAELPHSGLSELVGLLWLCASVSGCQKQRSCSSKKGILSGLPPAHMILHAPRPSPQFLCTLYNV